MNNCERCGNNIGVVTWVISNEYPECGFPCDTRKFVCEKCAKRFRHYITRCYKEFFEEEGDSE